MPAQGASAQRLVASHALFFPAAAAHAALVLPVSVLALGGAANPLPALSSPAGHAHEMLFGFALAVVAGNQLGPVAKPRLALLFGLWALARVAFLSAPQSLAAVAANVAFAALLAAQLAPRLLAAAKKPRNKALPLVLVAICACAIAFQLVAWTGDRAAAHAIFTVAVLLFALLMLFMGGRLLAPAVAGQFYRQGGNLEARVQPRVESGLIGTMLVASAAAAFADEPGFAALAGVATAVAGVLALVRLLRWRMWALRGRPDLLCLAAGYAWLALGLLLVSGALATGGYRTAALHVITVGSLGTLTLNVMAMTWLLRARRDPARARLPVWGTVLVAAATLGRVLAGLGVSDPQALLVFAASCWSAAFALLLVLFARARARG